MAFLLVDSFLNEKNGRLLQKSIRALELLLLSAGLISTLVMVKTALLPYSCEFFLSNLTEIWNSVKCLLSSHLYICIIINFMVVLIAASSTLHHHHDSQVPESLAAAPPPPPPLPQPVSVFYETLISEAEKTLYPVKNDSGDIREPVVEREHGADTNFPDDDDTMEATWRSINGGGKQRPQRKELKKSGTWDVTAPSRSNVADRRPPPPPPPLPPPASVFYETLISEAHDIEKTLYPVNDDSGNLRHEANTNLSDDEGTMEATWRSITGGGKERPQRKQLKTSETWDVMVPRQNNVSDRRPPPPPPPPPRASVLYETFISEAHDIEKTLYPVKDDSSDLPELVIEREHEANTNLSDDDDTMEATWRSITGGGKQRPQRKQLKKSETWDVPPQNNVSDRRPGSEDVMESTSKWKELRKSETFNDTVTVTCRGGLRRDASNSTSLEEFNEQVEAFIKKFNDNMKLQRQESDQRLLDMMRRGV